MRIAVNKLLSKAFGAVATVCEAIDSVTFGPLYDLIDKPTDRLANLLASVEVTKIDVDPQERLEQIRKLSVAIVHIAHRHQSPYLMKLSAEDQLEGNEYGITLDECLDYLHNHNDPWDFDIGWFSTWHCEFLSDQAQQRVLPALTPAKPLPHLTL